MIERLAADAPRRRKMPKAPKAPMPPVAVAVPAADMQVPAAAAHPLGA